MYSEITVKKVEHLMPILEALIQVKPIELTLKRKNGFIDIRIIRIDNPENDTAN